MEQQRDWSHTPPESMYNMSQHNSPFTVDLSSYFQRPAKIFKPWSRNSSPRHSGRRRTSTNVPISRTRSVLDKQRSSMPQQYLAQQQARPLSWHPKTYEDFNFSNPDFQQEVSYGNYYPPFDFHGTTTANGLVTPMSYAVTDEPQIQELITPLEELSAQENTQVYTSEPHNYQNWVQPAMSKDQAYAMDDMFPQNQVQQNWQWNHQTSMLDIPTAPSSPNFLPIQGATEASPLSLDTQNLPAKEDDGEELVGMGLYDSPADVQSSSLLFGGGFGRTVKKRSLKLEESFEPAPESSETSEENDDKQDAKEDDDAAPAAGANGHTTTFPIYQDPPQLQPWTMAGQSFFFDSEQDIPGPAAIYPLGINYMATSGCQPQYSDYGWM